jgi:hypothetical protein
MGGYHKIIEIKMAMKNRDCPINIDNKRPLHKDKERASY